MIVAMWMTAVPIRRVTASGWRCSTAPCSPRTSRPSSRSQGSPPSWWSTGAPHLPLPLPNLLPPALTPPPPLPQGRGPAEQGRPVGGGGAGAAHLPAVARRLQVASQPTSQQTRKLANQPARQLENLLTSQETTSLDSCR